MATGVDLMQKLINHIITDTVSGFRDFNLQVAVIPLWYKGLKIPTVIIEHWVSSLQSCVEVKVQSTRHQVFEWYTKFVSRFFQKLHRLSDNKDASPLLTDTASSSLFPLVQQDVPVGASIEVSFGPVSGSSVACSWIGFPFHWIRLDRMIATGYWDSTTVALNH